MKYVLALSSLGLAAVVACGSSGDNGAGGMGGDGNGGSASMSGGSAGSSGDTMLDLGGAADNGGTSASSGGTSQGNGGSAAGGAMQSGPVTSVTPITMGMACTSHTAKAQLGALDMFIMLDKSKSMEDATSTGQSKWELISKAINAFVADPKSAGIGAGIQFFGLFDAQNQSDCTVADYAKPAVPIAALNGNAAKISAAIAAIKNLGGGTPTTQALTGAIDYAAAWQTKNPTRKTIVLFATDGLPNGCNSTVDTATAAAKAGLAGKPSIQSYVIGVFGAQDKTSIPNLNSFAKAGGTGSAFIVDTTGDAEAQFLDAMNAIREANRVDCKFPIPAPAKAGEAIDYSRVAVDYTPGGGKLESLGWVASAKACTAKGGWYYDSNAAPKDISLCPTTCSTVQADAAAKVDIYLACSEGNPTGSGGTGSGGSGSGSGGAGTGGSGTGGSSGMCLLRGQSCQDGGDCCSNLCMGVCQSVVK